MHHHLFYKCIFFFCFGILFSCINNNGFSVKQRGIIRNESYRQIYVVHRLDTSEDYDKNLYNSKFSDRYILLGGDSVALSFSEHDIVTVPKTWIFNYYDWDTVVKYYKEFKEFVPGLGKRAFLKADTVTQEQLLKNNVLLIFKDNLIEKSK